MKPRQLAILFAIFFACAALHAQTVPAATTPAAHSQATPATAASPAQRSFHDPTYKISFDYPANWNFTRRDHEISTFRLDARTAVRTTLMRAVVSIPENPFPDSTFSGAYLYFSVTPHLNDAACARQAAPAAGIMPPAGGMPATDQTPAVQGRRGAVSEITGISFAHGHDEQRAICTVQRDEIYTTLRRGACYRFDLTINNFCGGAVSGVRDITPRELDQVRSRLEAILGTVRFDAK
jgi:hypothetical protein